MGDVFSKLRTIIGGIVRLGIGGPQVKAAVNAVEARNAGDTAYVVLRGADPVLSADLVTKAYADGPLSETLQPAEHGFDAQGDQTISYVVGTNTLTITPTGASFSYRSGSPAVEYTKSAPDSLAHNSATGVYYFYYDGATLSVRNSWDDRLILGPWAFVAMVYWVNGATRAVIVGKEYHGRNMAARTHLYLHQTVGARYQEDGGLNLSNYTISGDGSLDAHAQVGVTDGTIFDEDLAWSLSNGSPQTMSPAASIPVLYLSGATPVWVRDAATSFPVKQGTTRIAYNLDTAGTWTAPDAPANGNYVAMWLCATNDNTEPIVAILGQRVDTTLAAAQDNNTFEALTLPNLPTPEIKPIWRLIFQTSSTYANTPAARLRDVLDLRRAGDLPGGGAYVPVTHNSLGGRDVANSHPAGAVAVDTSAFGGNLSSADDDVQKALDTIDNLSLGGQAWLELPSFYGTSTTTAPVELLWGIFPGTTAFGTVTAMKARVENNSATFGGTVDVYDETNGNIMASATIPAGIADQIISMTLQPANIPAGEVRMACRIQSASSSNTIYLETLMIVN